MYCCLFHTGPVHHMSNNHIHTYFQGLNSLWTVGGSPRDIPHSQRKQENPERSHADTGTACQLMCGKALAQMGIPGTFWYHPICQHVIGFIKPHVLTLCNNWTYAHIRAHRAFVHWIFGLHSAYDITAHTHRLEPLEVRFSGCMGEMYTTLSLLKP